MKKVCLSGPTGSGDSQLPARSTSDDLDVASGYTGERVDALLAAAGLRVTSVRREVVRQLMHAEVEREALTPKTLYLRVGDGARSVSNLYRLLGEMVAAGLVDRAQPEVGAASVFLLRRASQPGHLACVACHAAEQVSDPWSDRRFHALARKRGLALVRNTWRLLGLCRACAAARAAKGRPSGR